jgi:hypothetical protein
LTPRDAVEGPVYGDKEMPKMTNETWRNFTEKYRKTHSGHSWTEDHSQINRDRLVAKKSRDFRQNASDMTVNVVMPWDGAILDKIVKISSRELMSNNFKAPFKSGIAMVGNILGLNKN